MTDVAEIARVVLPIGVNGVESVNCYVLPDGDRVTVVDCGVWLPDLPDGGLAALQAGLEGAGYALTDVGRIVITHAHWLTSNGRYHWHDKARVHELKESPHEL